MLKFLIVPLDKITECICIHIDAFLFQLSVLGRNCDEIRRIGTIHIINDYDLNRLPRATKMSKSSSPSLHWFLLKW